MAKEKKQPPTPREMLLMARIYRAAAVTFGAFGLLSFAILYHTKFNGQALQTFYHAPSLALFILPFLPAWILSRRARKLEKTALKLLNTE